MADGGNVEFVEIDGLVVKLRLQGACGSCPSSLTTMTMGIKRRLMEKIPVSKWYLQAVLASVAWESSFSSAGWSHSSSSSSSSRCRCQQDEVSWEHGFSSAGPCNSSSSCSSSRFYFGRGLFRMKLLHPRMKLGQCRTMPQQQRQQQEEVLNRDQICWVLAYQCTTISWQQQQQVLFRVNSLENEARAVQDHATAAAAAAAGANTDPFKSKQMESAAWVYIHADDFANDTGISICSGA